MKNRFLKKNFGETKVPCTLGKPILEVLLHVTSECIETCAKLYLQHVLEKRGTLKNHSVLESFEAVNSLLRQSQVSGRRSLLENGVLISLSLVLDVPHTILWAQGYVTEEYWAVNEQMKSQVHILQVQHNDQLLRGKSSTKQRPSYT